jgi:hypothetical protein
MNFCIRSLILILVALLSQARTTAQEDPLIAGATVLASVTKLGGQIEQSPQLDNTTFVWVGINDRPITDEDMKLLRGLQHVKGLRTLGLNKTKITDVGLKELQDLKELENLSLHK